mgnify:CR=1 FL=1
MTGDRASRRCGTWWPLVALIAVCAAAYIVNLGALQIGQHVDDAIYVSLGRSLAAGLGYVRYEDPRHPVEPQYPPGLPSLVALVLWMGGDLAALRVIPLAFTLISLVLADIYFRSRLACADVDPCGPWRWLALGLFGLNQLVVGYAGMVMSEAPFICLTLAALVLLTPNDEGVTRSRQIARSVGLALALAAAVLFRTVGLALVVGAAAWLMRRGRRTEALAVTSLTALLLAPWLIYQRLATGHWFGAGYAVDVIGQGHSSWPIILRPIDNLIQYATRLFPETLLPFFGQRVEALFSRFSLTPLLLALGATVTVAVIAGAIICARRRSLPDAWIAAAMALLLLAWPYRYTRFALTILPIAIFYLLSTATALAPRRRGVLYALAGLALAGLVLRDVVMVLRPPRDLYPDLRAAGEFITDHTEPEALIVTHHASGVALYAERAIIGPAPLKAAADEATSPIYTIRNALNNRPVYALERADSLSLFGPDALDADDLTAEPVAADPAAGLALHRLRAARLNGSYSP